MSDTKTKKAKASKAEAEKELKIEKFPGWEQGFKSEKDAIAYAQGVLESKAPARRGSKREFVQVYFADGGSGRFVKETKFGAPKLQFDLDHLMDIGWMHPVESVNINGLSADAEVVSQAEWVAARKG